MILTEKQINPLCEAQGLLDPFDPNMVQPMGIIARLGKAGMLTRRRKGWAEKLFAFIPRLLSQGYIKEKIDLTEYSKELPLLLFPGESISSRTLEKLTTPANIISELRGLPYRGNNEPQMCCLGTTWTEPGFAGTLPVSIVNTSDTDTIPIFCGMQIGMVVFTQISQQPLKR